MTAGMAVTVYCGSRTGADPAFARAARELGARLADHRFTLVCGGSSIGLMRELVDGALEHGGTVIGVRPPGVFPDEPPHGGLSEMRTTDSLQERKQVMRELADAFVALPGGIGTIDELAEIISWAYLGLHTKLILLLDVNGYWQEFTGLMRSAVRADLATDSLPRLYSVVTSPTEALDALAPLGG